MDAHVQSKSPAPWQKSSRRRLIRGATVAGLVLLSLAPGTALAEDPTGSIVGWGSQVVGVDLTGPFAQVAAGAFHSLGVKPDGSIVAWGFNGYGQANVPAPNSGFIVVAGGDYFTLGLKADGSIVGWGRNDFGQTSVPAPNTGFTAVAAGAFHSLGLKPDGRSLRGAITVMVRPASPRPTRTSSPWLRARTTV